MKKFFLNAKIFGEMIWEFSWFSKLKWTKMIALIQKFKKFLSEIIHLLKFLFTAGLSYQDWLRILGLTEECKATAAFYSDSLYIRIRAWLTLPLRYPSLLPLNVQLNEYGFLFFLISVALELLLLRIIWIVIRKFYKLVIYLYHLIMHLYREGRRLYYLQLEPDYSYQENRPRKIRFNHHQKNPIVQKLEIFYPKLITSYCFVSSFILDRIIKLRFKLTVKIQSWRNRKKIATKFQKPETISSRLVHVIFQLPTFLVKLYQLMWEKLLPAIFKAVVIAILLLRLITEPLLPISEAETQFMQIPPTYQTRMVSPSLKSQRLESPKEKIETVQPVVLEAEDQPLETLDQVDAKLLPKEKQKKIKKYVPLHKRTHNLNDLKQKYREIDNRQFTEETLDSNSPVDPIVERIQITDKDQKE